VALNRMSVTRIIKEYGRVAGVEAVDAETGEVLAIRSKAVINASGVEADAVRALDEPGALATMSPSRGSHVVLDRSFLPGEVAVMIPRTDDGRVLFAIPWRGRVLLGTTDTPVDHTTREPMPTHQEVDYLLDHAARYFARRPRVEDVLCSFAGLRPLLGQGGSGPTASLSREHAVLASASGLVTVVGGKWTTYRRMGRDAVDQAVEVAGYAKSPSRTEVLQLHGWSADRSGPFAAYGSDSSALEALVADHPEWGEPIHPRLPERPVEVIWAARNELARSVEDVLARRTRGLFLDARASIEAAPAVAALLASELGRDAAWIAREVESFRSLAGRYRP
jgi:glycerol-3-phosphate dehydrogenase